jgi:hypothetical protein
MSSIIRIPLLLCSLAVLLNSAAFAKPAVKEAEYKRSDTNFYWKGDVLKVEPSAVILPLATFTQQGDSYFMKPAKKAPKHIYVMVLNEWIEPLTPPDMTPLVVAPDAMQIREPQGDVQVALPSAPATFTPVTDKMTVPNGSVIKTGADGTAAVLFGGVNSARLIPNSAAAVQQTVTPQLRTTEIDLTRGGVFSKVGQIVGVKQDYKVHTPFGIAAARGTDFVSVALPARTDVWIAQGTVQLDQIDGKAVGSISAEGTGALKIIRYPLMPDAHATMMASAETMTAAMNFIPLANVKMKALHERMDKGEKMTPQELDYMGRIKKVPCLIKLTLVEPAPPATPPATAPAAATPTPTPAPLPPPPPATPPSTAPTNAAAPKSPEGGGSESTPLLPVTNTTMNQSPRTEDTPSADSATPSKTKVTKATSHVDSTNAPGAKSPNDTVP